MLHAIGGVDNGNRNASVGDVRKATRRMCAVAKLSLVEGASIQNQVEGIVALLVSQADSTTSRAIGEVSQRLEQELTTAPLGSVAASAQTLKPL